MAEPLYLGFAVHNHQPVGNLPWVTEEVFEKAYDPFLSVLERHAGFACVLHYSGWLLDWLEEKRPAFLERLARLVNRGQVELLTGGCYEPVASMIPETDLVGQTEELTRRLLGRFHYYPRGFWLAERVWEPHLPLAIASCGADYTLVDAENFAKAGIAEGASRGFFTTENLGQSLCMFPINQTLRRAIPFELPEKVVERLLGWGRETPGGLVVWGDDGEKLGAWPGTHRWVYEEGWLERFLGLLEQNTDSVRVITLRDYLSLKEPLGRVSLPSASYAEMMEWSEGDFRNFLTRYEESNWMHKRMLAASRLVAEYAAEVEKPDRLLAGQVSLDTLGGARRELWQSQSNDAYWHGVFGGLYLPVLRRAAYHHLLSAEKLAQSDAPRQETEADDFDADGHDEIRAANGVLSAFWRPRQGGGLVELDFLPKSENLLATLRRRRENYHGDMQVIEDWHGRYCFLDHFLHQSTSLAGFSSGSYGQQGDFVNQPYKYQIRSDETEQRVLFSREGKVWVGDEAVPVRITKEFRLPPGKGQLEAFYQVENGAEREVELWFGVEMNLLLSDFWPPERYFQFPGEETLLTLAEQGGRRGLPWVALCDRWLGIRVEISVAPACDLWFFPIKTLSRSEEAVEEVCQCTALLFHQHLSLPPCGTWQGALEVRISAVPAGSGSLSASTLLRRSSHAPSSSSEKGGRR